MGLLLGAIAAILLGGSDLNAARAGRFVPSVTVVRSAMLVSGVLTLLLLTILPGKFLAREMVIAAASGVLMALALGLLYQGYRVAPIGIVAPTSSVLLAMLPVAWDISRGTKLKPVLVVGMGIGIVALGLTSYVRGGKGSARSGFFYGATSGVLFGITFIMLAKAKDIGIVAVVMQRWTALLSLSVFWIFDRTPYFAWKSPGWRNALYCGLFAGLAMSSLQIGFQKASAGLVSVASSQFATVTVILAVLFNNERMHWWQVVGVTMTAVAVALMALG